MKFKNVVIYNYIVRNLITNFFFSNIKFEDFDLNYMKNLDFYKFYFKFYYLYTKHRYKISIYDDRRIKGKFSVSKMPLITVELSHFVDEKMCQIVLNQKHWVIEQSNSCCQRSGRKFLKPHKPWRHIE